MLPYKVLKFFDDVTSALVAVLLALLAVYAGYALWDNRQVYAAAEEVQASLLTLKPQEGGAPFAELRAVNADVCAWVTLDGTGVDYPVVQGKDNLTYVNTDVYGNFSLAGTIFLDTRCAPDFAGGYSLLYGHHMVSGQMFGDLEKYQDAAFLREHRTGTLLLPDGACTLEMFACLLVPGIGGTHLPAGVLAGGRIAAAGLGRGGGPVLGDDGPTAAGAGHVHLLVGVHRRPHRSAGGHTRGMRSTSSLLPSAGRRGKIAPTCGGVSRR